MARSAVRSTRTFGGIVVKYRRRRRLRSGRLGCVRGVVFEVVRHRDEQHRIWASGYATRPEADRATSDGLVAENFVAQAVHGQVKMRDVVPRSWLKSLSRWFMPGAVLWASACSCARAVSSFDAAWSAACERVHGEGTSVRR